MILNNRPTTNDLKSYAIPETEIFLGHMPDHDEIIEALNKKWRGRFKYHDLGDYVGIQHKDSNYLVCKVFHRQMDSKKEYVIKSFRICSDRCKYNVGGDGYSCVTTTSLSSAVNTIGKLAPITEAELVGESMRFVHTNSAQENLTRNQDKFVKCTKKFTTEICDGNDWGGEREAKREKLMRFVAQTINAMDSGRALMIPEDDPIVQKYREYVKTRDELAETISYLGERVILHVAQLGDKLYLGYVIKNQGFLPIPHFVQVPSIEALPQAVQRHIHTVNLVEGHDCDAGYIVEGDHRLLTDTHYALFISEDEVRDVVQKLINEGTKYDHAA